MKRLFGTRVPDLITVIVAKGHGEGWEVSVVGEGKQPRLPDRSSAAFDEFVATTDRLVRERYAGDVPAEGIGFQYGWYPWEGKDGGKNVPNPPGKFPLFEVRSTPDGYTASLDGEPMFSVTTARLADLPDAIWSEVGRRWPELAGRQPFGVIHWNRTLTPSGFVDFVRTAGR